MSNGLTLDLFRVTTCPSLPRLISVYYYCPGVMLEGYPSLVSKYQSASFFIYLKLMTRITINMQNQLAYSFLTLSIS